MEDRIDSRPICVLDSRHLMSILMYIHDHGPSRKTELYTNVSKNVNMPRKFDYLLEKGLIAEDPGRKHVTYVLTDLGEGIAEQLSRIEDVIKIGGCWTEGEGSVDGRGRALSMKVRNNTKDEFDF